MGYSYYRLRRIGLMTKIFFFFLLISIQVRASAPGLDFEFKSLLSKSGVGVLKNQAYCYSKDGIVSGFNINKMQRIASVAKLFTSLLVSETMDINQSFQTKIYIGKESLHIEGGSDPYFEEEKFLLLMKALNGLGYRSFKKVTFSRKFLFYDIALGEYAKITPEITRGRIAFFLNGKNAASIRAYWSNVSKFAAEEGILLIGEAPSLTSPIVAISDINPLLQENPIIYVHSSLPLHNILKTMNVQSKNVVAENLFNASSKIKTLSNLLKENGISGETFRMYNGSGLPIISGKSRLDNLATCTTVLKVISLLNLSLKKHNLAFSDIVAVNGGQDLGSFRERFMEYPETHQAVLAKTGTLKQTSSLAGLILVGQEMPFAILNNTSRPSFGRKFQDSFVAKMFEYLGPADPLNYTKIPIFPWNNTDFLQPLP